MQKGNRIKPLVSVHPGKPEAERFEAFVRCSESAATDLRQITAELRGYLEALAEHPLPSGHTLHTSLRDALEARLSTLSNLCRTLNTSCSMTAHLIQRFYENLERNTTKPSTPRS